MYFDHERKKVLRKKKTDKKKIIRGKSDYRFPKQMRVHRLFEFWTMTFQKSRKIQKYVGEKLRFR